MNSIEAIINSCDQLPPFPAVINRALDLMNNPRSSVQDIVEAIQYDQAITANVLKVCNSAYYGLRQPVGSLKEAVMFLGFSQLLEILLSGVSGSLMTKAISGYDLEEGELWKHSVSSALLSQIITRRMNREPSPLLFTAALIHDIGKVILNSYVGEQSQIIKELVQNQGITFLEAEKEVLGIDHAELSALITEKWNFPQEIVQAIRYHHTPLEATTEVEAVYLIYLSDLIAIMTGIGGGVDGLSYAGFKQIMVYFHLDEKDVERFMAQLGDEIKRVELFFQIERI
ncbi:MAG: HDOD domain-containing protein [Thermodesulfobacteriota bacterium]